ncbi:MAG TPA: amidohydrolase family protein [Bacteroidales bacterium]|nr:amidohydrolase family protein [Bacteroidales bacterium]
MSVLLKNATFIDWQTLKFRQTNILTGQETDSFLEFPDAIPNEFENHEVLDCSGLFVTKSFANAHHHIYSVLSRGMPPSDIPPKNFYEKLKYVWWKLDKSLDSEIIEASALYAAMMSLKAGVTFIIDHHASPYAIENSLPVIANAFEKSGVSHLLCYEVSDRDGKEKAAEGLKLTSEYLKHHQGLVGLHASFTVSDQTMKEAALLAEKFQSGVHIHVAEDQFDEEHCQSNYQMSVIDRLDGFGFLQMPKSIFVHCLHLDDREKKKLSDGRTWIVENMESNLNNRVGIFQSKNMGNRIMLGTDGMHSNMIRSAQWAYFAGLQNDPQLPDTIYHRLRNVHHYLSNNRFSGDSENNFVVLDYNTPTEINSNNYCGHFIYGMDATHVKHVISGGKLVVKDRQLTLANENDILLFSKEMGRKLWTKMKGI